MSHHTPLSGTGADCPSYSPCLILALVCVQPPALTLALGISVFIPDSPLQMLAQNVSHYILLFSEVLDIEPTRASLMHTKQVLYH